MTLEETVPAGRSELDPAAAVRLLTGADFWCLHPEPAIGLRRIVTSDGPAGVRGLSWNESDPSLNTPCPTAISASWDLDLVRDIGSLLGGECRRKGVDVLLGPTVNIQRTPVAGRHFECFSEDPLLTSRLAVAYVRGVQEHGVAATIKHFVGNDFERNRLTADVAVDARALREVYLPPFEAAVREAGVWAAMASYNSIGGTTMTENPLLRVLREEWGFDGVVMSDWFAARSLASALAELDLVMPGPSGPWGAALEQAMLSGEVPAETVNAKLDRVLRLAGRVGAFAPAPTPAPSQVDGPALLRRAAAAGFVLLRNEPLSADEPPVLPLTTERPLTVALIGDPATEPRLLGGGSAFVFPTAVSTPAGALAGELDRLGGTLRLVPGVATSTRIGLPAAGTLWSTPEEPGVLVTFLGEGDVVLGREHRTSTTFNWNNDFPGVADPAGIRAVEVRTTYRAAATGTHVLGCSGVGRHRIDVDGVSRVDTVLALPPGADSVEGLTRPPQAGHSLHLDAGAEVSLLVRREVEPPAEILKPDDEQTIVALQINVTGPRLTDEEALRAAEQAAAECDIAIVVVGTTDESEGEGFDRDTLALAGRQDELVSRVAAVNPRTVAVVNAGAPVLLPWRERVAAVLVAWLPGEQFGAALADVLSGRVEPGGRLPMTWPAAETDPLPSTRNDNGVVSYSEGLHVGHRRYLREGAEPAYWFGHGLGYTSWAYELLGVVPSEDPAEPVRVTVGLRNTGARRGREVVQVYLSRPESMVDRPRRWLAGFTAVTAEPGQSVTATVELRPRAFEHWVPGENDEVPGLTGRWAEEGGEFEVLVGPNAGQPVLRGTVSR